MAVKTLFFCLFLAISPTSCLAFDWGDFHKLAVIFGTFFGFGLGFTAIVIVAYYACMKNFFENFREEVSQTHRTWHPWPIGSVRWQLQQLVRTGRSNITGAPGTQFSTTPAKAPMPAQYLNVPALQSSFGPAPSVYSNTTGIGVGQTGEIIPIIRSSEPNYNDRFQPTKPNANYLFQDRIDRPTYFTPSPEKPIFEEYTITREESFISRGSTRRPTTDNDNTQGPSSATTLPVEEAQIVRSTTTRHSQRSLHAPGGSTFI